MSAFLQAQAHRWALVFLCLCSAPHAPAQHQRCLQLRRAEPLAGIHDLRLVLRLVGGRDGASIRRPYTGNVCGVCTLIHAHKLSTACPPSAHAA